MNAAPCARRPSLFVWTAISCAIGCSSADKGGEKPPEVPPDQLMALEGPGKEYRTPLAGEGFRTEVLGEPVAVQPRDRSSVSAWDAGLVGIIPGIKSSEINPFGSLFFWRRPDEDTFFRAVVVGVYDEVFFSKSAESLRPFEGVLTFNNFTVPVAQAEYIDGERVDEEELLWGQIRPGLGFGYRKNLQQPGHNDNMLAISLTAEPGYMYFDDGDDTADNFRVPQDTFEPRGHLQVRLDAMERNLLELAHRGIAVGSDLVYGHRSNWEDWGVDGAESAGKGRDYILFSGYMVGAAKVPYASDRHHVVGSLFGGTGSGLDRFSDFRVGGGPVGDEYESIYRPNIPGAAIGEFTTDHYAVAIGEYRWEPIFFAYLGVRTSVSYVDRLREKSDGRTTENDFLYSIGLHLTSGFFLHTRLEIAYDYNTGVIRHDEFGGHEVVVHLSGSF